MKLQRLANMCLLGGLFLVGSLAASAQAQTIVQGVEYREITDFNQPRGYRAQPQLGSAPQYAPPVRTAQFAPAGVTYAGTVATPADQRPALTFAQPNMPSVATYQRPYAYGYGYTSCGSTQPVGYVNSMPPQQLGGLQPVGAAPFNPYAGSGSAGWRPLIPIRNMPNQYTVGQGIIGQPKLYVPDQPVRNFIRYITP